MLPVFSCNEAEMTACFVQDIGVLLDSFSEKDTSSKQSLQQMLSSDQATFSGASIQVLASAKGSAGSRYVLHLLRKNNLLMEALLDPRAKRETAIAAAHMIPQLSAPIDADLERLLSTTLAEGPSATKAFRVLRLLDVLEAASAQPRFNLYQTELLRYPDSTVRSRAALLIARSSKSVALVARLLSDEDPRVQANAVEALWTFDAAEARPLFLQAAQSRTPRVAGNAAVGLYRIGDIASLSLIFGMARESDAARRSTAAWAMGETGDPRFLTFLADWFPNSSGGERANILQSLGRIRRLEKSRAEAGQIEIRSWETARTGPRRKLVFSLWSPAKPDLSALKPTQFAIWDGGTLVEDYEVAAQANPPLMIAGFVLPRFATAEDPYGIAALDAIERCLKYKRPDDLWRLDRYLLEPRTGAAAPLEKAALPYDESILGPHARMQQRGFLSSPQALRKLIENSGPKERAADDSIAAFDRHSEAMIKFSGKRKLFLFLTTECGLRVERHFKRLLSFLENERIALHVFAPKGSAGLELLEKLSLATEGGTFSACDPTDLAEQVQRIYLQSINRFEVSYTASHHGGAAEGRIQVSSVSGCGQATLVG